MKIIIIETKRIEREIECEFPKYYKHDLTSESSGENCIFGRITQNGHTNIQIKKELSAVKSIECEVDFFKNIKYSGLGGYFKEEYNSTKEEYEKAKQELIKFTNQNL